MAYSKATLKSCSRNLQFCINHSFLLNLPNSKIYDEEFIKYFKTISNQLQKLLDYYKRYNEKTSESFKKSDAKDYIKSFVIKLSQYLNLSSEICYDVFKNYLISDGKLEDNDLQSILTRGYNTISIMQKIKKYYYEERLSLIRIIRYAFCDWKEEFLVLSKIILTVSGVDNKLLLFKKLLESYRLIINEVHQEKTSYEFREDNWEEEMSNQGLEERIELLETILIAAYSMKDCRDGEVFDNVLSMFLQSGFDGNQIKLYNSRATQLMNTNERIRLLQSLIILELAGIDRMFVSQEDLKASHFLIDGKSLNKLNVSVNKFGNNNPSDGILMLFMSLMRNNFPIDNNNSCTISSGTMAETAICKLGLFSYLKSMLLSKPYMITSTEGSYLGLIVHCVLFDLLSLLCYGIHLNSLESKIRQDLVNTMCVIVKPIITCSDTQPLNSGFMKMLEDLSSSFPANLSMINVIGSLMKKPDNGPHNEIIEIIAEFIDNLSWFSDGRCLDMDCVMVLDSASGDFDRNSVRKCRLVRQYQPYLSKSLALDSDCDGYLMDGTIAWAVHYSVWDVIGAEVELTRRLITHGQRHMNCSVGPANISTIYSQFERLEIIIDFLTTALECQVQTDLITNIFSNLWCLIENDSFFIEGCEALLITIINLTGKVLCTTKDVNLIKRIVSVRNLFPNSQLSVERIISNQSLIEKIWSSELTPINIKIIQAYLKFNVCLIQNEKYFDSEIGVIPSTLIFGSINFVIRLVLDNVNKRAFQNSSDVTDLAMDCLVFITEILSIKPKSFLILSDSRKARLELIQKVTHEILVNTTSVIKIILAMSCMDVDNLLRQCNLSNQMLGIYGTEEKLSRLVWLALTLIKFIFIGPELNNEDQIVIESGSSVIMKLLDGSENDSQVLANHSHKGRGTMTFSQQYVLKLLEFLAYPYSIKISRMSLDVLKLIVQNTSISIVACLGEKTSFIRDLFLRICASTMEDQIVRANLFDFLSVCIMCGRHGVLQLIGPGKSVTNVPSNGFYDSCITIISHFKFDDEISVKLLFSVSKLFSSLWIKECYSATEILKSMNIWQAVIAPIREFIHKFNGNKPEENKEIKSSTLFQLFSFVANIYGLFGMELYSNSGLLKSHKDTNFIKSFDELYSVDLFIHFLSVFDHNQLESRLNNLDHYMSLLLPAIIWWKTLLVTVLSINPAESGIKGLSVSEEINLILRILKSISNLHSISLISDSHNFHAILDHLSFSVLEILNKRIKSIPESQINLVFKQLIAVTTLETSRSVTFHNRHIDLLASCVLIQHHCSENSSFQLDLESLVQSYLFMLSSHPSLSTLERKVFIQALNLCIGTDLPSLHRPITSDWVHQLAETGILHNCFVTLNDCIKKNDLTLLPQTLMLLLIRVAHTNLGSIRIHQSFLLATLQADVIIDESDGNSITFMSRLIQLAVVLINQNKSMSHEFGFRVVLIYWDKLYKMISDGCQRLSRPVNSAEDYDRIRSYLTVGQFLFDLVWNLLAVRGTWSLFWPITLIEDLEELLKICVNTIAIILSQPSALFIPNSAYILYGKMKTAKQMQLASQSPKVKLDNSSSLDDSEQPFSHLNVQLASLRLESILYELLHSSMLIYSRSTLIGSEEFIYKEIDYNGGLLNESFGECKIENCNAPLSFGSFFSIINSTHCLLRDDIPHIVIGNEKCPFNRDQMRQIHEITLSTIVSHSWIYLAKYETASNSSNKAIKNTFISNLRSELNYYLTEFVKTRRRNTMSSSSPLNATPRLTSTPYSRKSAGYKLDSSSITDSFDSFCAGIDQYKKALDSM